MHYYTNEIGNCRCRDPRPEKQAPNEVDFLCKRCGYLVRRWRIDDMADYLYHMDMRRRNNAM